MTQDNEDIMSLEELRYRMSDVFAITELVTKVLEYAAGETIAEMRGLEPGDPIDDLGHAEDAYNTGIDDGYIRLARELVDLVNKSLMEETDDVLLGRDDNP